jgi:hypothetical protein
MTMLSRSNSDNRLAASFDCRMVQMQANQVVFAGSKMMKATFDQGGRMELPAVVQVEFGEVVKKIVG